VSFSAITFCVASQRVIPNVSAYLLSTQSGNFWIYPRKPHHLCAGSRMDMMKHIKSNLNTESEGV
jgi:hypothetical protein